MRSHLPLVFIVLCLPFVLWAVCGILPTFDDFTTLQSPWWVQVADPGYFFPDSVRRPFDALLGVVVGLWPPLYPALNHVLIVLGHACGAVLVFSVCRRLRIGAMGTNIATLFFFFSPATLGATLACDGFNQTYAQLWGLLSLWLYLGGKWQWMLCVVMAALSKENGLAWAVVPPVVAYAFGLNDRRQAVKDVGRGLLLALTYFVIFAALTLSGFLEYSQEYYGVSLTSHVKDLVQLLSFTWVPADYMSAVYPPTRSWPIVGVTLLLSAPFLLLLAARWRLLADRRLLALIACFFILVSPHLLTVVSIMHNYAALSMAAIIMAFMLSPPVATIWERGRPRPPRVNHTAAGIPRAVAIAFALFMCACLFTDAHHLIAARESGLLGKRLAMQAIEAAGKPLSHVLVINIDDAEEPRYSSFCVRPVDAFGWGLAVKNYTNYEWKTVIDEASLPAYDPRQVETLADSALQAGDDAVWVVGHRRDSIDIITRRQTPKK